VDNNCDGSVDEDPSVRWYPDADGDGYGLESGILYSCTAPAGYVPYAWMIQYDCDDADAAVNPVALELCNSIDDNCDGEVDEASENAPSTYEDLDGDGYGGMWHGYSCTPDEPGFTSTAGDCDDTEASRSPAATEVCDGHDTDCDGTGDTCVASGELSAGATVSTATFFYHWDTLPDETGDGVGELLVDTYTSVGELSLLQVVDPTSGSTLRSWINPDDLTMSNASSGLDYNQDGVGDLTLSAWSGSSEIYLYSANQADGAVLSAWGAISDSTRMNTYWAAGTDFGSDGQPELMVDAGTSILLFQPIEGATLGAPDALGRVEDAAWVSIGSGHEADTNGDGAPELWIEVESLDRQAWVRSNRLLAFDDPMMQGLQEIDADQTLPIERYEHIAVVQDMDGDGTDELWLRQFDWWLGAVHMELVDGVASGSTRATLDIDEYCSEEPNAEADFNGDSWQDLVYGCSSNDQQGANAGKIWFFTGPFSGALTVNDAASSYTGPQADAMVGYSLYAADLDQDGRDDVLTTTWDSTTWTSSWVWLYGSQLP
jgi:hypothetical protein